MNILGKLIFLTLGGVVFLVATPTAARAQLDQPTQAAVQLEFPTLGGNSSGSSQTSGGVQRLLVSLLINGQEQGQNLVLLSPGGIPEVRLRAKSFLEKTAEFVLPDIQQKLLAAVDSEGNLTLEALRQNGLAATFDSGQLQLQIQIPSLQRQMNIYNLLPVKLSPQALGTLRQSLGSNYIFDLQGKKDYAWSGQKVAMPGRQPINFNLEGGLNLKGSVLEGSSDLTEAGNPAWLSGDLHLEQDVPDQALRLAVGNLSIPVIGYQSSQSMLGVTVASKSFLASNLLAAGRRQFTYSFGFASTENEKQRSHTYDWAQPTLTLSHQSSLTDTFTLGGYLQGDLKQQLAGIEGAWVTSWGNLKWDLALSHESDIGFDYAFKFDYNYTKDGEGNPEQRSFGLTLEHRGPGFTTLDNLLPHLRFDLSAYYSQNLFWGIKGRLSNRYQFGGAGATNTYIISLELSKSFGNGWKVNLNLSKKLDRTSQDEQNAYLSVSWSLPR